MFTLFILILYLQNTDIAHIYSYKYTYFLGIIIRKVLFCS